MEANKIIAKYVHWRESYTRKAFIIMWSDGTWEEIEYPSTHPWVGDKTYKQYMNLNKVVASKMTKEETMKFINEKFEGLREI